VGMLLHSWIILLVAILYLLAVQGIWQEVSGPFELLLLVSNIHLLPLYIAYSLDVNRVTSSMVCIPVKP
jgi:hypothetical protein